MDDGPPAGQSQQPPNDDLPPHMRDAIVVTVDTDEGSFLRLYRLAYGMTRQIVTSLIVLGVLVLLLVLGGEESALFFVVIFLAVIGGSSWMRWVDLPRRLYRGSLPDSSHSDFRFSAAGIEVWSARTFTWMGWGRIMAMQIRGEHLIIRHGLASFFHVPVQALPSPQALGKLFHWFEEGKRHDRHLQDDKDWLAKQAGNW